MIEFFFRDQEHYDVSNLAAGCAKNTKVCWKDIVGAKVQVMKDGEFLESLVESFCRDQFRAYSEVGKSSWELFVQLKLLFCLYLKSGLCF